MYADALPKRSPSPARVMSRGAAAIVSGSANMATGGATGKLVFIPANSITARFDVYPSMEAAVGTLTNWRLMRLATYLVVSVMTPEPTAMIESVPELCKGSYRRDTLVSSASKPWRSGKQNAVTCKPDRVQIADDPGAGSFFSVCVHHDERSRPAAPFRIGDQLLYGTLVDDNRVGRGPVDRAAGANTAQW